jgi:hypothetical protein
VDNLRSSLTSSMRGLYEPMVPRVCRLLCHQVCSPAQDGCDRGAELSQGQVAEQVNVLNTVPVPWAFCGPGISRGWTEDSTNEKRPRLS